MAKTIPVTVRLDETRHAKLTHMAMVAGTNESWVLRRLIDRSQVVSGTVFADAPTTLAPQTPQPAPESH